MRKFLANTLLISTIIVSTGLVAVLPVQTPQVLAQTESPADKYNSELAAAEDKLFRLTRLATVVDKTISRSLQQAEIQGERVVAPSIILELRDSKEQLRSDIDTAREYISDAREEARNGNYEEALELLEEVNRYEFADFVTDKAISAINTASAQLRTAGVETEDLSTTGLENEAVARSCSVWSGAGLEQCLNLAIVFTAKLGFSVMNFGLGIIGTIMDESIKFTVTDMKKNLGEIESLPNAWSLIRDIANMSLIFILVYIAIDTILQTGRVNTGKALRQVIIVALLINFSYFFTQIIIDVGNVLTLTFYDAAKNVGSGEGIGSAIMDGLGLTSVHDTPPNISNLAQGSFISVIVWAIGGYVLFGVTALVMGGIAFILAMRYIVFVMVLATSAAAFAMSILPATSEYSKKWWDLLIKNTIVAPILFIFLWLVLEIINSGGFKIGGGSIAGALSAPESGVSVLFNFIIAIGLLLAALMAAVMIGGSGSKHVQKFGKKLNDKMGSGFAKRTGGASLRGTVGRAGLAVENKLSESRVGNFAPVRGFRKATTGALAGAKFGTKLDAKKAAKERDVIDKKKAEIGQKKLTLKEEKVEAKYKDYLRQNYSYKSAEDGMNQAQSTASRADSDLKKLRKQQKEETDVVAKAKLDTAIAQKEQELKEAQERYASQKKTVAQKEHSITSQDHSGKAARYRKDLAKIKRAQRAPEPGAYGAKGTTATTLAGAAVGTAVAGPAGAVVGAGVGLAASQFAKARNKVRNVFDGSQNVREEKRKLRLRLGKKKKEGKNRTESWKDIEKENTSEQKRKQAEDALGKVLNDDSSKPKKDKDDDKKEE